MNDGDNDTIGYTRGGAYLSSGGTEGEGQQRRLKPEAAATDKSASAVMWSKTVISKWRRGSERFRVLLAGREDLDEAGALCIKVGAYDIVALRYKKLGRSLRGIFVCLSVSKDEHGRPS